MPFVADDLGAWLISLLADAGRKKLATFILGTEQERALRSAASAAVQETARELSPDDEGQARHVAMVISQVFSHPQSDAATTKHQTVLEALRAGVAIQLAVLEDGDITTEPGLSSADALGIPAAVIAETLTTYVLKEIIVAGSRGGALFPLASQLNDDVTHLQGLRLEGLIGRLAEDVQRALSRVDDARTGLGVRAGDETVQHNTFHIGTYVQADQSSPEPGVVDKGAGRAVLGAYLGALIAWLDADQWPRRRGMGGPRLSATTLEREMRVAASSSLGRQVLSADAVMLRSRRLVILGGAGMGKTWLARRAARLSALEALDGLNRGMSPAEVELPLFTTCAALTAVSSPHGIRDAAVSAALDEMGDYGGPEVSSALRCILTRPGARVVLIVDSLDEAPGSGPRLAQVSTLPWRVILTSRPGAWDGQIDVDERADGHDVCVLQPMTYPADVESLIRAWFAEDPRQAAALASQIAGRPALRQAATVPLILTFYCILGGRERLPESHRELHGKVIRRLLSGVWHVADPPSLDLAACLDALRAWAWAGAQRGEGPWLEEISTERGALGQASYAALDHVASPVTLPDFDGNIRRRFLHRSLYEHLVAEHVVGLPVDEAAQVLLPHLWFDPDWEHAAPTALAAHPERDRLLQALISRITAAGRAGPRQGVIPWEARWSLLGLLARTATESREADWSAPAARLIGQARVELALSGRLEEFGGAGPWPTSNRKVRDVILGRGSRWPHASSSAQALGRELLTAGPSSEEKGTAREMLLSSLTDLRKFHPEEAVDALILLGPSPAQRRRARELIPARMSRDDFPASMASRLAQLDPTPDDRSKGRRALLAAITRHTRLSLVQGTPDVVMALSELCPSDQEKQATRHQILRLLEDRANARAAFALAAMINGLGPSPQELHQAADLLVGMTSSATNEHDIGCCIEAMTQLATVPELRARLRGDLLVVLERRISLSVDSAVCKGLVTLSVTDSERRSACESLLQFVASAGISSLWSEGKAISRLSTSAADRENSTAALIALLESQKDSYKAATLGESIAELSPSHGHKATATAVLTALLRDETDEWNAYALSSSLLSLQADSGEQSLVKETLRKCLDVPGDHTLADLAASTLIRCNPSSTDKERILDVHLQALDHAIEFARAVPYEHEIRDLAERASTIAKLDPVPALREDLRAVLLKEIAREIAKRPRPGSSFTLTDSGMASKIRAAIRLSPTPDEKAGLRADLLEITEIHGATDDYSAQNRLLDLNNIADAVADGIAQLSPDESEKQQARQEITRILASPLDRSVARALVNGLAALQPTIRDLEAIPAHYRSLISRRLLDAVRRNSSLDDWLAALPPLEPLPPDT